MNKKRLHLVCVAFVIGVAAAGYAGDQDMIETLSVPLALNDVRVEDAGAGAAVFTGARTAGVAGCPALPRLHIRVLLPPNVDLSSVTFALADTQTEAISGEWDVAPAPRIVAPGERASADRSNTTEERNTIAYRSDAWQPQGFAGDLVTETVREWRIAAVVVAPYRYNPVRKQLLRLSQAKAVFTFKRLSGFKWGRSKSSATAALFRDRVRRMVANFTQAVGEYDELQP